ncbi:hypothetical protein [Microbulbifer taiwanensis]|uniref:hypothetical protein n=1 Tax=Microbulbifer taiwanensis TaxID=986746 RepID=UPI0036227835
MIVLGSGETFNSNAVSEPMRRQQSTITSVNALIDNLPGVSVNEGIPTASTTGPPIFLCAALPPASTSSR